MMGLGMTQDRSGNCEFASGMAEGTLFPLSGCQNSMGKCNEIAFAL